MRTLSHACTHILIHGGSKRLLTAHPCRAHGTRSYIAAERCSEWRLRVKDLTHTMGDPGALATLLHEVDQANAALQVRPTQIHACRHLQACTHKRGPNHTQAQVANLALACVFSCGCASVCVCRRISMCIRVGVHILLHKPAMSSRARSVAGKPALSSCAAYARRCAHKHICMLGCARTHMLTSTCIVTEAHPSAEHCP